MNTYSYHILRLLRADDALTNVLCAVFIATQAVIERLCHLIPFNFGAISTEIKSNL